MCQKIHQRLVHIFSLFIRLESSISYFFLPIWKSALMLFLTNSLAIGWGLLSILNLKLITQWPQIVFEMFKKIVSSHIWWRIWRLLIPINFSPSSLFLVSLSLLLNWIKQMCVISDDDMCHSFFYCVIFLVKTNSNNKIHVQNMHFYLQYYFRFLTIKLCS